MAVHVVGFIALIVFYIAILVVGIAAYWKKGRKKNADEKGADTAVVARRDIGWIVGSFTMTATWCGGGFINGTAEIMFTSGLLFAQPTIGNALGLLVGGLFFAKPMRTKMYKTMLDPFEEKYGQKVSFLMYLVAFASEVFWIGAIMAALGSSVAVVMDLDFTIGVSISVAFCVSYVVIGGIYSVTWTDMAEILLVMFGLVLCTPFIWRNEHVHLFQHRENGTNSSWTENTDKLDWLGHIEPRNIASYVDTWLVCTLGAVPWQDYYQRVLSAKTPQRAQILSFVGAIGCILVAIPSAMIGLATRYTDWEAAGYSAASAKQQSVTILPLALEYLTPKAVAFFGVGTVSAAVMSSADASLLSIGGMFAHNLYKGLIRPQASEKELMWVLRASIVTGGVAAALLAIFVESVVSLWSFACDIVYVVLFPQLVCVLFIPFTNGIGASAGFLVGVILRILAGEPSLHIPTVIRYPMYDPDTNTQLFPTKTFAMLLNFGVTLLVSYLVKCWTNRKRRVFNVQLAHSSLEPYKF